MHDVDLDLTVNSGQIFLWYRQNDAWGIIDGQRVLQWSGKKIENAQYRFLRMDDNYNAILSEISKDGVMRDMITRYRGLRLLRQDPFQCCISFIVSANSNIGRIRAGLHNIAARFGRKVRAGGMEYALFPGPSELARASISDLRACGIGYRATYVKKATGLIHSGSIDLESLRGIGYRDAKRQIMRIPGVGNKVADCILLFSLEKTEAFPLDRWMARALQRLYPQFDIPHSLTDKRYDMLHDDVSAYFGRFAGYAQQFMFRYIRDQNQRRWY